MFVYETRYIDNWDGWTELTKAAWSKTRLSNGAHEPTLMQPYFNLVASAAIAVFERFGVPTGSVSDMYISFLPAPRQLGRTEVIALSCYGRQRTYFVSNLEMPWFDEPCLKPLPPRPKTGRPRKALATVND